MLYKWRDTIVHIALKNNCCATYSHYLYAEQKVLTCAARIGNKWLHVSLCGYDRMAPTPNNTTCYKHVYFIPTNSRKAVHTSIQYKKAIGLHLRSTVESCKYKGVRATTDIGTEGKYGKDKYKSTATPKRPTNNQSYLSLKILTQLRLTKLKLNKWMLAKRK